MDGWSTGGGLPPDNKDDRQVVADSPPGMAPVASYYVPIHDSTFMNALLKYFDCFILLYSFESAQFIRVLQYTLTVLLEIIDLL